MSVASACLHVGRFDNAAGYGYGYGQGCRRARKASSRRANKKVQ